ncbi:transposase family protein [Acidiphilium multivorum]|uniref:transposase family protein n=1 Tax=Acidiphilium multivorum TaxID=62140 RepID=UPI001E4F3E94|nr:transposase family protein [Acidiphilium multivorum]
MKVFLSWCFALERRADGIRCWEQSGIDDVGCRPAAAVACVDELDGTGGCGKTDQGQLEQASGVLHLGFFEPEANTFRRPEHFLGSPPQPVEPLRRRRQRRWPRSWSAGATISARLDHGQADRFLALPNGIPSHDTFRRVFMLIDTGHFEACFEA